METPEGLVGRRGAYPRWPPPQKFGRSYQSSLPGGKNTDRYFSLHTRHIELLR